MTCPIKYEIIATGSDGNAVVINDIVLIDCGVPFKALKPYYKKLKLVLLTHIHADHFCRRTVRRLAEERPLLRFACGRWLAEPLVSCDVRKTNIDILDADIINNYGVCNVIPFYLVHNVPNFGYKLHFPNGRKMIYATDTNNLNGIYAYNYDLYLIEANYEDEAIAEKIAEKKARGEYAYERQVIHNHLSKAKCDDFIYRNNRAGGTYVYMHRHKEREEVDCDSQNNQI